MMELPEGSEDRCKRPLVAIMSRLMSDLLIYYVSIGVDLLFCYCHRSKLVVMLRQMAATFSVVFKLIRHADIKHGTYKELSIFQPFFYVLQSST
jgi:hypothetical protein